MVDLEELNGSTSIDAALVYVALGWPVFPVAWPLADGTCACRSGQQCRHPAKHPLVPGGPRAATLDADRARDWWAHWPAAGIGMLTGTASGLAVLDVDPHHGGDATLQAITRAHAFSVPLTLTALTGGGGRHHFFVVPKGSEPVPNTSGRLPGIGPAPGLDIRGEGGYVVVAPSLHRSHRRYQWSSPVAQPAPLPHWLAKPPPPPRPHVPPGATANERYVAAVLQREADAVARSPEGSRSDRLNRAAFSLGTLAATGALTASTVEEHLLPAALVAGLGQDEALRTIRSGLRAGLARPR